MEIKKELEGTFKNKKVLITGHTGFKGSWLSVWLHELGAKVIGISLDPKTDRDNFVITNLKDKIIDIRGDIRYEKKLMNIFSEFNPEIVFHLAAQPLVSESYKYPALTFETNVIGTVNILDCCRLSESVRTIIVITSDKCYENQQWPYGYRENDRLGGFDPYSASKACSELVSNSYRQSFFYFQSLNKNKRSLSTVRAGNVIGGGDWSKDRIIPDCIKAIESENPLVLKNPGFIRPWQFVLDPLIGYLLLATKMEKNLNDFSGAWNFGPYPFEFVTVKKLAEMIIKHYGKGSIKRSEEQNLIHETGLLTLDINKSIFYLGWKPTLNINEVVALTVDWYKVYNKEINMYDFCASQISGFMKIYDLRNADN